MESWRQIEGFEGLYDISDKGRVWSRKRNKILIPAKDSPGYLMVTVSQNGKQFNKHIHRLVATHFISKSEGLPQVHHKNEIKTDNRVENLQWVSHQYNNEYSKAGYYVLYDKNDEKKEIYNLNKFAKDNGLNFQALYDVVNKKAKSYVGYTAKPNTKYTRPRKGSFKLTSPTGEVYTFQSQYEAADFTGNSQGNINNLLKGKAKSCKGWTLP